MTEDPRKNKPSASGLYRMAACAGSWALESGIPSAPPSEDAAFGTNVHAVLSDTADFIPTNEEIDMAERCRSMSDKLIAETFPEDVKKDVFKEKRIWRENDFSGQADLVVACGNAALVIDYKTGRGDVDDSDHNIQLRALSVLVWRVYGVQEIYAAIIQPMAKKPVTVVKYYGKFLELAERSILAIISESQKENAPRTTGDHCKYCKALGVCPEASQVAMAVDIIESGGVMTKEDVEQKVATIPGEDLSRYLGQIKYAEMVFSAVKDEARRRLEASPDSVPGYELKNGKTRTKVTDIQELRKRLFDRLSISNKDFWATCSVSLTNLDEVVRKASGLKGRDLDALVENLIDGIKEEKKDRGSLAKKEA